MKECFHDSDFVHLYLRPRWYDDFYDAIEPEVCGWTWEVSPDTPEGIRELMTELEELARDAQRARRVLAERLADKEKEGRK